MTRIVRILIVGILIFRILILRKLRIVRIAKIVIILGEFRISHFKKTIR